MHTFAKFKVFQKYFDSEEPVRQLQIWKWETLIIPINKWVQSIDLIHDHHNDLVINFLSCTVGNPFS